MIEEQATNSIKTRDIDDSPVWSLRGVRLDIRQRMKLKSVAMNMTLPEVVDLACDFWLANGQSETERSVA